MTHEERANMVLREVLDWADSPGFYETVGMKGRDEWTRAAIAAIASALRAAADEARGRVVYQSKETFNRLGVLVEEAPKSATENNQWVRTCFLEPGQSLAVVGGTDAN